MEGGETVSLYDTYGIYGIRNKVNNNLYIGKTGNNFGDRRDCHIAALRGGYGVNSHLQRAWDKYGEENFEFEVLQVCDSNDDLNALEQEYIRMCKALGNCYNIADGGEGGHLLGKHMSEETKRKIGEKNRENMLGKKASDETRAKMSVSQKARFARMTDEELDEYGKAISVYASGYKWSDEAKQRFAEKQQTEPNGAKYTVEHVKEIRRLHEECGLGYTEISEKMNISRHTVYLIATYRRWKNV